MAANYLIPQGLATQADERQVKALDHQKRMLEGKRRRTDRRLGWQ